MGTHGMFLSLLKPEWVRGARRKLVQAAPAAGAEWEWTALTWGVSYVQLVTGEFTASAQVANRQLGVEILDANGLRVGVFTGSANTAAFAKITVTYSPDWPQQEIAGTKNATVPLPKIFLSQGWTLKSRTPELQTEDKYSSLKILVEEFDIEYDLERAERAEGLWERIKRLEEGTAYA